MAARILEKRISKRILISVRSKRKTIKSSFWMKYLKYAGYYITVECRIRKIGAGQPLNYIMSDPGLKILFPKESERMHAVHSYLFLLIAKGLAKTRFNNGLCVVSRVR